MIRSCDKSDEKCMLDYIGKDYHKCLYLYIDIIKYGCKSEYTKSWIMSTGDQIKAVMLAYHSALHIYAKYKNIDGVELCKFIRDHNPSIICASSEIINYLSPYIEKDRYIKEIGHVGKYSSSIFNANHHIVEQATINDVEEIANLLYKDEDIGASYSYDDLVCQIKERLSQNFVRSYVIKENSRVVAHLGTGAETKNVCTISYVITAPEYRGRGLSSSLFAHVCKLLYLEGKEIFSVYYPENSRRLHHKMGFVDCCEFGKLYRNVQ